MINLLVNFKIQLYQSFLKLMNPSPGLSLEKVIDILDLAGRAMKSNRVRPVIFPAECFPTLLTLFSFP